MLQRAATTTGTFRVKSLLLFLRDRGRTGQAAAFAKRIGGGSIVDDEIRPLSRTLWQRALRDFVELGGEDGLRQLSSFIVHPENLGAWSRILRGVQGAEDLLTVLAEANDGLPGDPFWTTEKLGPRRFRAHAYVGDASDAVERRYIGLALAAELEAIPLLFGLPRGRALPHDDGQPFTLSFTLEWNRPGDRAMWTAGTFAVGWALLSAIVWWADALPETWGRNFWPLWVMGPLLLAAAWGAMAKRDAEQRAQTNKQRVRILALEREALLNQNRSKEISRPHEEPVIAGQYKVGKQLGVGASGAVWEATRLTDGAQVALKLLRTAVVHDVRATDRLRREAEALGLSWHPNVVEVLDTGILPSGVGFLVMERLYGETLAERLHSRRSLTAEETRQLALQAADALFAVHSAGVVHRDIKPDNLFLGRADDGSDTLKLIDFGVARISWAETRLTRSGVRIGTIGYASPEQEEGAEVDGRTDIYGLGASLLHCLTGRPPAGQHSELTPATNVVVSREWLTVINKMTATEPAERFANARDLREALLSLAPDEPKDGSDGSLAAGVFVA